jgi:hypothetical protein
MHRKKMALAEKGQKLPDSSKAWRSAVMKLTSRRHCQPSAEVMGRP